MSIFRRQYRPLSIEEAAAIDQLKATAEDLYEQLGAVTSARAQALARTKLEECVMWAVKGMTG